MDHRLCCTNAPRTGRIRDFLHDMDVVGLLISAAVIVMALAHAAGSIPWQPLPIPAHEPAGASPAPPAPSLPRLGATGTTGSAGPSATVPATAAPPASASAPPRLPLSADAIVKVKAEIVARDNRHGELQLDLDLKPGWKVYALTHARAYPRKMEVELVASDQYRAAGPWRATSAPEVHFDATFQGHVEEHSGHVRLVMPIEFAADADAARLQIAGKVLVQAHSQRIWLPPKRHPFVAQLAAGGQ
jgi:hypothetical protein